MRCCVPSPRSASLVSRPLQALLARKPPSHEYRRSCAHQTAHSGHNSNAGLQLQILADLQQSLNTLNDKPLWEAW
jgi:hypothetical protein